MHCHGEYNELSKNMYEVIKYSHADEHETHRPVDVVVRIRSNANVKFLGNPSLFQSSIGAKLKFKASFQIEREPF